MSRASKDRRAKEKRRRGYQSALERKVAFWKAMVEKGMDFQRNIIFQREEAKKNETIAKLALRDALGRALIIKHLDDQFNIAVLVEHRIEDTVIPLDQPKQISWDPLPGYEPPKRTFVPGSRNKVVRKIDKTLMEMSREQDVYLELMTGIIGQQVAELIMDQLLRDCLKAKESVR